MACIYLPSGGEVSPPNGQHVLPVLAIKEAGLPAWHIDRVDIYRVDDQHFTRSMHFIAATGSTFHRSCVRTAALPDGQTSMDPRASVDTHHKRRLKSIGCHNSAENCLMLSDFRASDMFQQLMSILYFFLAHPTRQKRFSFCASLKRVYYVCTLGSSIFCTNIK